MEKRCRRRNPHIVGNCCRHRPRPVWTALSRCNENCFGEHHPAPSDAHKVTRRHSLVRHDNIGGKVAAAFPNRINILPTSSLGGSSWRSTHFLPRHAMPKEICW